MMMGRLFIANGKTLKSLWEDIKKYKKLCDLEKIKSKIPMEIYIKKLCIILDKSKIKKGLL